MLTFKNIYEMNNRKEIETLYNEAFPKEEKLPFYFLIRAARRENIKFDIICDEDKIIGLTYSLVYENSIYLLYFAVNSSYRGRGYGGKILEEYRNKYKEYNIILVIEEVNNKAKNFEEREKRKKFYLKNGFYGLNSYLIDKKVTYEFLSTNANIEMDEILLKNLFKQMINPIFRFLIKFYKINIERKSKCS